MTRTPSFLLLTALAIAAHAGCKPSIERSSSASASDKGSTADSLTSVAGTEWVLERWNEKEPVSGNAEVTLRLEDGRLSGSSGCNRYSSDVKPGGLPRTIVLGPVAGTRMACPEPAMAVEDRFLRQLAAVKSFRLDRGRLELGYELDGATGSMLFRARTGP